MSRLVPLFLLLVLSFAVSAQSQYLTVPGQSRPAPGVLLGVWGDPAQCQAFEDQSIENPGSPAYEISQDWIKQGWFHCLVSWQGEWQTDNGLQAQAFAQCGEDLIREYRVFLQLEADTLTIRWTDDYSTKSLNRCSDSG